MIDDIRKHLKEEFEKIILFFRQELGQLRSSRPSPALVENLIIDCYQTKMPLKQVASISVVLPATIRIEPWDKNVIPAIVQAISASQLNLAPIADNQGVKLNLPPLSEERRAQMVKLLNEFSEKARMGLRSLREQSNKKVETLFKEKMISEDEKFRFKEEVQKITDEYMDKIKEIGEAKEKELYS